MTTAIAKTTEFIAVDSLWTDIFHNPVKTQTKKYIYSESELYLFSGDHLPILLEQALLIGLLDDNEYLRFYEFLDPEDVFGCLIVEESTGKLDASEGHTFDWNNGIAHTGSGGKFASDFYFHAERQYYKSEHGCNIDGALHHAFYWDRCSGLPIKKRIWKGDIFDNTEHPGLDYKEFVSRKIDQHFKGGIMNKTLRSSMRTSPSLNGVKVSVTEAKNRLERRKARLARKAA
jgi:hypothetical protein